MYIELTDIEKHIQTDIVSALSFDIGNSNITVAISQAISQIRSYLTATYLIDAELAKTGADRDSLIVMLCNDLAVYHIFSSVDASHIPQVRIDREKAAINFLKDVQKGDAVVNIARVTDETKFLIYGGSNVKRVNQY